MGEPNQAKKAKMHSTKKLGIALAAAVVLILLFSWLAGLVHTSFGAVKIWDISYLTEEGGYQRALLYVPKSATAENPAPAIVACHGYNNTAEVQDINSIELSRRGYVVIAIDAYRHGLSSETDPDMPAAAGGGTYSALQYLGTLPYVDSSRIGMVGHSMGGTNIQAGALKAFAMQMADPDVVVPKTIIPTASWLATNAEGEFMLKDFPVNMAVVNAYYEEFAGAYQGGDFNLQPSTTACFGFERPEYGQFYRYGQNTPLTREEAVAAGQEGQLRVEYMNPLTHPGIHFSKNAAASLVDVFDITLKDGRSDIAPTNQIWRWKHYLSGIAEIAFILFAIPLGGLLLKTRFFGTIVRKEPEPYAIVNNGKSRAQYIVLFFLCMVPPAVLYYFCMAWGSKMLSRFLPLSAVNGIALLNILTGLVSLLIFFLLFRLVYKKNGASINNMGVKLPVKQVLKGLLLAVVVFAGTYSLLLIVDFFFKVDFRFWVFSFRTMTPFKWSIWLRYTPFWIFFFLINGLTLNMSTRIRGKSEVLNTLLMFLSSAGGLFVLCMLDYGKFFATGYKMFPRVGGASTSLAGILLWGVIFILPLASLISRYFFKKTGSIWTGAFINSFLVTLFAVSNTVVNVGILY